MAQDQKYCVAIAQLTPVFLDNEASLHKVATATKSAVDQGAKLILFPESFLPGYPRAMTFGTSVGQRTESGREIWQAFWENSIAEDGPEVKRLAQIAIEYSVYLVMGVTERDQINRSLFCSFMIFDPGGRIIAKHRKIKPTAAERIIWAEGDGRSLITHQTSIGRIGGLICWENYMPLARMALYSSGIDIYLAPTADSRETWTATLRHIALEGRCFVLGCNQFFRSKDYDEKFHKYLEPDLPEVICHGGSMAVDPMGQVIAGPAWGEEKILMVELDFGLLIRSKLDFDPVGHYARGDLFTFNLKNRT